MEHLKYDSTKDVYKVEGREKCRGAGPIGSRAYWKRARSGRGTIYLYRGAESASAGQLESEGAFGWIPEHKACTIYLGNLESGWCNVYNLGNSVIFININSLGAQQETVDTKNFLPQRNRHWVTGDVLPSVNQQVKEPQMANIDQAVQKADFSPRKLGYKLGESNRTAFFNAAYLEAGALATKQLVKVAQKALPMMARGYADTVLGKLLLANIAQMAVQYSRPDNEQLVKLTDAMVATAYLDAIRTVDLDSIIDQMIEGSAIKNALKRAAKEDTSST